MAKVLAAGDIVKLQAYITDQGQGAVNTLFYVIASIGTPACTDADFASQWELAVGAAYKAVIGNNISFRGAGAQVVWPLPMYVQQYSTALQGFGTAGATQLAKQTTGLTSWRTPLAGRKTRGRTYWPFPTTTMDQGDGTPTGGAVTNYTTLSNQILNFTVFTTGGRTATAALIIWTRKAHTYTAVTGAVIHSAWATQRRRGDFGRLNTNPI